MKIDYFDSFLSISKRSIKFILMKICYMTKFLFANTLSFIIFKNTMLFNERNVIFVFEYFKTYYHDNEFHFKDEFIT